MSDGMSKIMEISGGSLATCSIFGGGLFDEPSFFFAALPSLLLLFLPLVDALREQSLQPEKNASSDFRPTRKMGQEGCARSIRERYALTDREEEVMILLSHGLTRNAIGERLYLSRNTVDTHIRSLYAKIGCHKKDEIIRMLEVEAEESSNSSEREAWGSHR